MEINEICFNELSLFPLCKDNQEIEDRIRQYVFTLHAAREKYKIKKVRYYDNFVNIHLSDCITIQDYINSHLHSPLAIILINTFTMPYVDEDDEDVLNKYCETQVFLKKETTCNDNLLVQDDKDAEQPSKTKVTSEKKIEKLNSHGFNAAYCIGTFCIGFMSELLWKSCLFDIIVNGNDVKWACISQEDSINNPSFEDWYKSIVPITLVESKYTYDYKVKHIHLRNDHGKDVLEDFSKCILRSEYVDNVINSLPFNRNYKKLILRCYDDGKIELVLHWTDNGYGIVIQSTGRNIRETNKIAEILTKEYDS